MIKKILVAIAMLTAALVPVGVASPAHAYPITAELNGCYGLSFLKTNTWGINKEATTPFGDPNFRLASYAQYWYCPNGSNPSRVKVIATVFCATKTTGEYSDHINGFKYNPYYTNDNNVVVNPPQDYLPWPNDAEDGEQHCTAQDIPAAEQVWMKMSSNPKWTLSGWIDVGEWPDDEFTFKENGYSYKYIGGASDPDVTL